MKCEKCGKEINPNEKYYTAVGIIQCEDCNTKSNGTVSMDFIFDKIVREVEKDFLTDLYIEQEKNREILLGCAD